MIIQISIQMLRLREQFKFAKMALEMCQHFYKKCFTQLILKKNKPGNKCLDQSFNTVVLLRAGYTGLGISASPTAQEGFMAI